MKKLLFAAAVAGVALAGCVSNEPEVSAKADSKIAFAAPLVSNATRTVTGEIKNSYPIEENFIVNAKYYTDKFSKWTEGQSYMTDVEVEYKSADNAWASTQDYYWPKNGTLTFFAYSPADHTTWKPAIAANGDAESLAGTATVPADGADVDLLYSALTKDQSKDQQTTNTYYNGVDIMFYHALSSIKFMVQLSGALNGATIEVNGVKLAKVNSKGDFAWNLSTDDAPVWSNQETVAEYVAVTGKKQEVSIDAADLADANALILLPQVLAGATEADNLVAVVNYTIKHGTDDSGIAQESTIDLSKLTYGEQDKAEWQPGKRYVYTIKFGLDRIIFAPQVKDWEKVTVTE